MCYLSYQGKPIKAARLFAGYEHEKELKRISNHFDVPIVKFKAVKLDIMLLDKYLPNEALNEYFDTLADD